MYNELLHIGPFTIYGYGLMIGIGVICALLLAEARAKKFGLTKISIYSFGLTAIVVGFLCAKLLFCIVEFRALLSNPWAVLSGNGFIVYGGIIGGILAAMVYCRVKKEAFLPYFDLCVPSVAIAQGFGRIGCFLAGCCYGRETDSFLGVIFPHSDIAPSGVKLLPTQLFASVGDFLIAGILLWYASKKPRAGKVGGLYLILYSVGRFGLEFLRNDYRGSIGFLSTSQFISIFILIAGVLLWFADRMPGWKQPKIQEAAAGEKPQSAPGRRTDESPETPTSESDESVDS